MSIPCIWEHNGNDTLLWAQNAPGAYTRGASLEEAVQKMPQEIQRFHRWTGLNLPPDPACEIIQDKPCDLAVRDADSDVLFEAERLPLSLREYEQLKALVLKSAKDFLQLFESIPNPDQSALPERSTFYGAVPRTARQMLKHTQQVNAYYFGEIGVEADNEGTLLTCREKGFLLLEQQPHFLQNRVCDGSYGEEWSLRKVLRRFLWHDRIHARAMWRMAQKTFAPYAVSDPFFFGE